MSDDVHRRLLAEDSARRVAADQNLEKETRAALEDIRRLTDEAHFLLERNGYPRADNEGLWPSVISHDGKKEAAWQLGLPGDEYGTDIYLTADGRLVHYYMSIKNARSPQRFEHNEYRPFLRYLATRGTIHSNNREVLKIRDCLLYMVAVLGQIGGRKIAERTPASVRFDEQVVRANSLHGVVFISYVHEDKHTVNRLAHQLESQRLAVWLDKSSLDPGMWWKDEIKRAIQSGMAFVACFSENSVSRDKTYMREELTLAIEEIRLRSRERAWFFPVRLDDCLFPDMSIGGGQSLRDIHSIDLFPDLDSGVRRLASAILRSRSHNQH